MIRRAYRPCHDWQVLDSSVLCVIDYQFATHTLVAVLISGGNIQQTWSLERIFAEADQAVGVEVLSTLYAQMGVRHLRVDLNQLWLDLGVQSSEGRLVLDDSAPKAAIRQAITR